VRGIEQVPWLYDPAMALLERTGLGRWRAWLAGGATGERVLDLGCGTGRNLTLLAGRPRLVGLDPCLASLRHARKRVPSALLVRGRAEALPFRDEAFDTVVSGLVFCSVADVPRGLAEVRRVLRDGGRLRLLEHVRASGRVRAWLQDRVQPAWTWLTGGCHPNRDTEGSVRAAGFVVDEPSRRARGDLRRFEARRG
jgi:ubiquinone/menaquinone biosynthesis C-methylase UbiE